MAKKTVPEDEPEVEVTNEPQDPPDYNESHLQAAQRRQEYLDAHPDQATPLERLVEE